MEGGGGLYMEIECYLVNYQMKRLQISHPLEKLPLVLFGKLTNKALTHNPLT